MPGYVSRPSRCLSQKRWRTARKICWPVKKLSISRIVIFSCVLVTQLWDECCMLCVSGGGRRKVKRKEQISHDDSRTSDGLWCMSKDTYNEVGRLIYNPACSNERSVLDFSVHHSPSSFLVSPLFVLSSFHPFSSQLATVFRSSYCICYIMPLAQ